MKNSLVRLDMVFVVPELFFQVNGIWQIRICWAPEINKTRLTPGEKILMTCIVVTAPDNLLIFLKIYPWLELIIMNYETSKTFPAKIFVNLLIF